MRRVFSSGGRMDSSSWRSYVLRLDIPFLAISLLLFAAGTFCVYIATVGSPGFDGIWLRHTMALTIAVSLATLISLLPSAHFAEFSKLLYVLALLLLILVLTSGRTIHGSRSWFVLGPIQFQPSEFAKMATIIFVSQLVVGLKQRDPVLLFSSQAKILAAIIFPAALVLLQHDVSSTIGFCFIALVYLWGLDILNLGTMLFFLFYGGLLFSVLLLQILAGLEGSVASAATPFLKQMGFGPGMTAAKLGLWFAALTVFVFAGFFVLRGMYVISRRISWVWALFFACSLWCSLLITWGLTKGLKGYQKNRIISFVLPNADPLGSGYNILQSKIAVGSGGFFGRGVGLGSQTTRGFLPENHTDFAFSSLGETTGFVGSAGLLFLLASLLWRLTRFMELARDDFGKLAAMGFWGLWIGEIAINIACVLGLFPVLGVGLPFVSYGGTRLVMNGISIGLLLSISRGFYVYR